VRKLRGQRPSHLRLVATAQPKPAPHPLENAANRKEFERLSQRLVDVVIEVMDLVDDDPDLELSADDFDDDAKMI
jgi:hypothetical protein